MNESFKKDRSPSYPKMPLSDALELIKKLYSKIGKAQMRPESAMPALGYTSMNGAALGTLSTLSQYGLLERERGGNMSVSALALKMIHPLSAEQESEAKRESALKPTVFADIFAGGYHDCAEEILCNHLIQNGFTSDGARKAASVYKQNSDFSKLDSLGIREHAIAPAHETFNQTSAPMKETAPTLQKPRHPMAEALGITALPPSERPIATFRFQLDPDVSAEVLFHGNILSAEHIDTLVEYLEVAKKRVFKKIPQPEQGA